MRALVTARSAAAMVRWLVAGILLLAAILKWRELLAAPVPRRPALGPVPLLLLQVGCESALAIWLISGLLRRLAWIVTLVVFGGFLGVSLWKAVRGDFSCGCFGSAAVNPWYAAGLDAAVLGAWCFSRRWSWRQRGGGASGCWIAGVAAVAVGGAFAAVWVNRPIFEKLGMAGELPPADHIVYFNACDWVGRPFPLIEQIDVGGRLSKGKWIVVLYDSGCRRCDQLAPKYLQLAIDWEGRGNAPGIALVDVIADAPPADDELRTRSPALVGRVVAQRKWFIVTPAIVAIDNGKVIAARDDDEEPAAQWVAHVFPGI